jgi:hypothetical protein
MVLNFFWEEKMKYALNPETEFVLKLLEAEDLVG